MTDEQRDTVARLLREGYAQYRVAIRAGVSREKVRRVVRQIGPTPPPEVRPPTASQILGIRRKQNPTDPTERLERERARVIARQAPKAAPAVRDLASGQTPWRCYCTPFGVPATGPTCPACGTAAPWADLMEAA
jgi:hypothetical protein